MPVNSWVLVLDTSAVFAWVNKKDPDHPWVRRHLENFSGDLLFPIPLLSEVGYLVEKRMGVGVLDRFLEDLEAGFFVGYWDPAILPQVRRLVLRYQDLPLGFADAYVAVTALFQEAPVVTLDHHFLVLARGEGLTVLHPDIPPP